MATKAKLIVVLKADDTVVAEVEDNSLWQKVLSSINQGTTEQFDLQVQDYGKEKAAHSQQSNDEPITKFAKKIGVTKDEIVGALDPTKEEPYLRLDVNHWEQMKKQLPASGRGAISPTAIVATMLCQWFKETGLGNPKQAHVSKILNEIHVKDHNPSRSINKATWLQSRPGGYVVLNSAEISRANEITRSFCEKKWITKD